MAETARVQVATLGRFEVRVQGQSHLFAQAPRVQSLLAYLVLHRETPKSRRFLWSLLWPDISEGRAAGNLRQLIHRLRQQWPECTKYVEMTPHTMRWRFAEETQVDAEVFQQHLCEGSMESLQQAAALYQGDVLPALEDAWVLPLRAQYRQMYLSASHRLIALYKGQRDYRAAIAKTEQLIQIEPLDEEAYRTLIRLYASCRERAMALRTYQSYAKMMAEEFLASPDMELEEVVRRLQQDESSDTAASEQEMRATSEEWVGQQNAWAMLQEVWEQVRSGSARMALLWGEAGVGKSRAAKEFAHWLRRQGVTVVQTACCVMEKELPFAVISSLLRAHPLPPLKPLWRQALSWLLPEMDGHPPSPTDPTWKDIPSQKQRLFEIIARVFLRWDQPLVVFVDDLQWCDAESLGYLHYFLLRHAARAPLFLLCTLRTTNRPSCSSDVYPRLASSAQRVPPPMLLTQWETISQEERLIPNLHLFLRACTEACCLWPLPILPLASDECTKLLHQVAPDLALSQMERIALQTQGIPLHLIEAARAAQIKQQSKPDQQVKIEMPHRLCDAIITQIHPCDAASVWVIALLAALERESSFDLLYKASRSLAALLDPEQVCAHISPKPSQSLVFDGKPPTLRTELLACLSALLQRALLLETRTGWVRFSHQLICEQIRTQIPTKLEHLFHRAIASALESLPVGDPARSAPILAHHWQRANETAKAQQAFLLAAREACARHAWTEARAHYQSCLQQDPQTPMALSACLEITQDILLPQGEDGQAERLLQTAQASIEIGIAQPDEAARILLLRGRILHRKGEVYAAKEAFLQALHQLEQVEQPSALLDALFALSSFFSQRGEYNPSRDFLERALSLAQTLHLPERQGDALQSIAVTLIEQNQYDAAEVLFERALECYHTSATPYAEARALNNLAVLYIVRGQYPQATALCERTLQVRRQLGDRAGEALALTNLGNIHLRQQHLAQARQIYEQALGMWQTLEHSRGEGYALNNLGAIYRDLGDFSLALFSLQQGMALATRIGDQRLQSYNDLHRSVLHRYTQQFPEAHAHLDAAMTRFESLKAPIELACCCCEACFLAMAQRTPCPPDQLQIIENTVASHRVEPTSELGQSVRLLERARQAFERGQPLYLGQDPADLPPAIALQSALRSTAA